jgi:hypothetical protein
MAQPCTVAPETTALFISSGHKSTTAKQEWVVLLRTCRAAKKAHIALGARLLRDRSIRNASLALSRCFEQSIAIETHSVQNHRVNLAHIGDVYRRVG